MSEFVDRLTVLFTANADGFTNVVKGVGNTTQTEMTKAEGAINGFGENLQKTALLGAASLVALGGALKLENFAKGAVDQAVQLDRATAALNAQLLEVGAQAGVTSAGIDVLANSIQASDAIYAGNVKQAAALLLTFREVRNEAGAGNDVFNKTLSVAGSLSNVFGRDLTTVTLQLGRALENPLTGMQALQRSGVTLSQELRTQIRHMAASGDLMGAQKALLGELSSRYTEAGEKIAKADPFQQLSVSMAQFKNEIGHDLLPAVTDFVHILQAMLETLGEIPGPLRAVLEIGLGAAALAAPVIYLSKTLGAIGGIVRPASTTAEAATETKAAASGTAATESTSAQGKAAAGAAATNAELTRSLAGLSAELEIVTAAFAGLNEQLAQFATSGAGIGAPLEALTEVSADATEAVAGVETQLNLFGETVSGAVAPVAGLTENLAAVGEAGAVATEGITGVAGQLELMFGTAAAGVGQMELFDKSLVDVGATSATATGQLELFDKSLIETSALAQQTAGQLSLLDAAMVETGGAASVGAGQMQLFNTTALDTSLAETGAGFEALGGDVAASGLSLSAILGPIAAVGAGLFAVNTVGNLLGKEAAPSLERMTAAADNFAKSKIFDGALLDQFGQNAEKFPRDLDLFFQHQQHTSGPLGFLGGVGETLKDPFSDSGTTEINRAKTSVGSIDSELTSLVSSGNQQEAARLFQVFADAAAQAGYGVDAVKSALPQYTHALEDNGAALAAAAAAGQDYGRVLQGMSAADDAFDEKLKLADRKQAIKDAGKKVEEDYADAVGASDKAHKADEAIVDARKGVRDSGRAVADANQRLTDSYTSLQDAQDRVVTATHTLRRAQEDLDEYNSARGVRERALKLDILQRRYVTTPEGEEQKQLDLLQNEDDNKNKKEQLTDAVTNAQRGLRDANKAVADSYRKISDAEVAVQDATDNVGKANERVSDAIKARKKISADASEAIAGDNRKVQEAELAARKELEKAVELGVLQNSEIKAYLGSLKTLGDTYAPGSPLSKNIDTFWTKLLNYIRAVAGAPTIGADGRVVGTTTYFDQNGNPVLPGQRQNGGAGSGGSSGPTPTPPASTGGGGGGGSPYPPWFNPPRYPQADGNVFSNAVGNVYASGGEDHVAEIATAGPIRMWAEPETGGEAYIPLAGSKRSRSTSILSTVAEKFGLALLDKAMLDKVEKHEDGDTLMYAEGGTTMSYMSGGTWQPRLTLPSASQSASANNHHAGNTVTVNQENHFDGSATQADLEYANRDLGWRLSRMGRS
jgi:molybdenum-dependent DNA-binding transcriptional regulator ModE